jgi:ribose-phosphate pyrophosphokinase
VAISPHPAAVGELPSRAAALTPTRLAILAGSGHDTLAGDIARLLDAPLLPVTIERFPDGELSATLRESVRGRWAAIIQPTGPPVDEHVVELLALADACRRAAAARIIAVLPYFGYARGDRRAGTDGPVMASLVARLIEASGIDHVVTVDLHAPQIEGFFHIPVDELDAVPLFLELARARLPPDIVVVSPDLGRLGVAARYADRLGTTAAVIHKRRTSARESHALRVVGEVEGRACLIVDDMIATGGTIAGCADALLDAGALPRIAVAATHGLFLPGAAELLRHPAIGAIWVTDTLPQPPGEPPVRTVVPIAPILAEALARMG